MIHTSMLWILLYTVVIFPHSSPVFFANSEVTSLTSTDKYELPATGGKTFTVQPKAELTLLLKRTERSWQYVIFQAHSLYRSNLVSKDSGFTHETSDMGSDAAVLFKFPYKKKAEVYYPYYLKSNFTESYNVSVIAIPYCDGAPFPGGCCLTCNMDLDPNIQITQTSAGSTQLTFSFANVFFKRNEKEIPCDGNTHPGLSPEHYRLQYNIYQSFLPEGDLTEDTLFDELEKMAYPQVIKTYGTKVASLQAPTIPRQVFDTLRGQGVIYNIIVVDPTTKQEAAYSPVHTYGCSFTSKIDSCQSIVSAINKVFAVIGAAVGLVMCFCGHRLFKITLFLGGVVNFGFIFFIILSTTVISYLARMLLSAGIGVFFGLLMFTLWWFTEYTRLCLLINALFLGFLGAGTLFFTPLGDSDIWQSGFNYGIVIICLTLIIPFLMLPWPKVLSIVYTSVVSAYGFILGIDVFIHTSLSYIVLDIVIRAVEPNYGDIVVRRPFQTNDIILSCCWGVLALCGIASQFYTTKRRLHFPKSGYLEQKRVRKYYVKGEYDETTPILVDTQGFRHNDIC